MNKKQAIEKYKDTPLYFTGYHKHYFYFSAHDEKLSVTCSPFYIYDFEICNTEKISSLLDYLDEDEITIRIDGKEVSD